MEAYKDSWTVGEVTPRVKETEIGIEQQQHMVKWRLLSTNSHTVTGDWKEGDKPAVRFFTYYYADLENGVHFKENSNYQDDRQERINSCVWKIMVMFPIP